MRRVGLVLPWEEDMRVRGERSRWVAFLVFVILILGLELWGPGTKQRQRDGTSRGANDEICSVQEMQGSDPER